VRTVDVVVSVRTVDVVVSVRTVDVVVSVEQKENIIKVKKIKILCISIIIITKCGCFVGVNRFFLTRFLKNPCGRYRI